MDNTTKKILQFLARIIRWQVALNGGIMSLKTKKMLDDIVNGNFSDFEEKLNAEQKRQANHMREMETFWKNSNPTTLTEE